jgi:hypothetical protein
MFGALAVVSKSLTAMQIDALGQDTAVMIPVFDGTASLIHDTPPSEVPMMTALPKIP